MAKVGKERKEGVSREENTLEESYWQEYKDQSGGHALALVLGLLEL